MKTNIIILALLIVAHFTVFSQSIKIEPIKFDYQDIVNYDDNMYLLANKGYIQKYNIQNEQMEKIQVFNSGTVIKLFRIDNIFYAFNDLGEMGVSNDNGKSWQNKKIDDKNLLCVIQDSDYFYVRDSIRIFRIDKEGTNQKEYPLNSPQLASYSAAFEPNYLYSMCLFIDKIAIETDSSKILLFDKDLKLIDSVEIKKSDVYINDTLLYSSGYRLATDGEYLYATMYQRTKMLYGFESIYRIDSAKNIDVNKIVVSTFLRIKEINDQIYYIDFYEDKELYLDFNRLSFKDLSQTHIANWFYTLFNDFYMKEDNIYIVGKGGLFVRFNSKDSTLKMINEQFWIDENRPPLIINDSSAIFFSGDNRYHISYMYPYFYITNNLKTYQSTITMSAPNFNDSLKESRFFITDFDKETGTFYLIGKYSYRQNPAYAIFTSNDTLRTLNFTITNGEFPEKFVWYQNIELDELNTYRGVSNNITYANPKIKSIDTLKYYINTSSQHPVTQKMSTGFTITNNQYYPIGRFVDSGYALDYVFLKDTNSFLIHCANTSDSGKSEVRYTVNKGASWEYVHKYPKQDTLLQKYDIEFQGKNYLILFHFDGYTSDKAMYMDIVDAQKNEWRRLREWDLTKESKYFNSRFGLSTDDETLYFAIGDTLFTIQDIYDQSKWQYKILPDSGMMGDPIVKYGNKFIAKYWNKYNNIYGYGLSVIGFDDTLSVNDYAIERKNYFYAYPPYPLPAGEIVQARIFWDLGLDINTAEIKVYDIYGKEISNGKDLAIVPESGWSGTLIWNCKGVTPGVYLITIKYGTERRVIKVVKG